MKNNTFTKLKCGCGNTAVGTMEVSGYRRPVCVWCKKVFEKMENSHMPYEVAIHPINRRRYERGEVVSKKS